MEQYFHKCVEQGSKEWEANGASRIMTSGFIIFYETGRTFVIIVKMNIHKDGTGPLVAFQKTNSSLYSWSSLLD